MGRNKINTRVRFKAVSLYLDRPENPGKNNSTSQKGLILGPNKTLNLKQHPRTFSQTPQKTNIPNNQTNQIKETRETKSKSYLLSEVFGFFPFFHQKQKPKNSKLRTLRRQRTHSLANSQSQERRPQFLRKLLASHGVFFVF